MKPSVAFPHTTKHSSVLSDQILTDIKNKFSKGNQKRYELKQDDPENEQRSMVLSLATVGKTLNPKLTGGDYTKQEANDRDLKTVLELPRKTTNKTCASLLDSVRHDGEPRSHLPDLTNRSNRSVSQMVRDMSASRLSKRANDPQLVFDEINLMQQEIMRKSQIAEEKTNTLPLLGYGEFDSQK